MLLIVSLRSLDRKREHRLRHGILQEGKPPQSLDPLVPIGALMKTWVPGRILTGLLAGGAFGCAVLGSKDVVNGGQLPLVLFNSTTDDAHLFFV
jgi:hypothetical protein